MASCGYEGIAAFTLDGTKYKYMRGDSDHQPETTRSWEYWHYRGLWPHRPLVAGTLDVYAEAQRWNPTQIIVGWDDDDFRPHWGLDPAGNVRRITDSERDIE